MEPASETGGRVVVVGFGSIGQRHVRLLAEMGYIPVVVSRRDDATSSVFASVEAAFADGPVRACVVADETDRHVTTLAAIRATGFGGPVLVEKPLAATAAQATAIDEEAFGSTYVAYNLRFHPLIQRLRQRVSGQRVLSVAIRVGQDLATWRTGRDPTASYSARRDRGGGVLRDLSHELDYFTWLFGPWQRVAALGGRLGSVTIDSDDCWAILIASDHCPAGTISLDYHSRWPVRSIVVQFECDTVEIDLIAGRYRDAQADYRLDLDRDQTYRDQLKALLGGRDDQTLCSVACGLGTMRLIEAIEQAAAEKRWIER